MPKKLRSKLNPNSRNMARRTSGKKSGSKPADASPNGGIVALTKELFQAAIVLRGSIEPADYRRVGAFIIPENARWQNIRKAAQADDIKVRLDDVLEALETKYPAKLKGLLPRIRQSIEVRRCILKVATDVG